MATPYDANQADFLGEGTAAPVQAPAMSAAALEEARQRKIAWLANQGLDPNGNPLPAYGTPQSQGGTAQGYQTMLDHPGSHVVYSAPLGSNDVLAPGTPITRTTVNTATGNPSPSTNVGSVGVGDTSIAAGAGFGGRPDPLAGGVGGGAAGSVGLTGQTNQGTKDLMADIQRRQNAATDQFGSTVNNLNGSPLTNPNATQQAANQASGALGPAPTVNQGLADRGLGAAQEALGMQRSVYDQLLNGPNTAARLGSQVLRNQLALARSAAGGPGAVQEALRNAQMAAPELEAQAAQAATNETLQRTQAAGNVAAQAGQTALGTRQQDVQIAQANQQASSALIQNVTQLTGQQLDLDQRNQELLGQMARDLAAQNFNWSKLSADQQEAEFDRWVKTYQIDQTVAAQIKAASIAADKGAMDYIVPIIGSLASLGSAALAA